ncbi:MAG TPA: tRNA 2-thiouridine(34) synthase MnmA [Candidatus Pacearchaeota archaeon]|nr:tRNA 2-thiouridine(34) synthase MnmA [Candidatus Pacearchaeota archaeon]
MKIAILMSGGIDSSFASYLLLKQGFNIIGITFLQTGNSPKKDFLRAQKIAKTLSIPHFYFNIKNDFKKEVIVPFLEDFKNGKTPNPCPICNKKIKLGLMMKKAKNLGADYIATGHYARKKQLATSDKQLVTYQLLKGKDKNKDQSYFLWMLSQRDLKKLILPLGGFTKEEVWQGIENSPLKKFFQKNEYYKESQDVCFLSSPSAYTKDHSKAKLSDFLKRNLKTKPGPILDKDGKIIGDHQGIHFFTIGQRSGLHIGAKSPKQNPLYVVKIDKEKNAVIVGEEKDLYQKEILIKDLHLISEKEIQLPLRVKVKIRARHKAAAATILPLEKKFTGQSKNLKSNIYLIFDKPQRALAPGQHAVFYQRNILLGGGIIM